MFISHVNEDGEYTNDLIDIVNNEVTIMCYKFIEENEGQRPTKKYIYSAVARCLQAALNGDPKHSWLE